MYTSAALEFEHFLCSPEGRLDNRMTEEAARKHVNKAARNEERGQFLIMDLLNGSVLDNGYFVPDLRCRYSRWFR
jgi:hypothetical protein